SLRKEFEAIVENLSDALDFSRTIGAENGASFERGGMRGTVGEVDFYTSHEGLMLDYEEALTREFPIPLDHGKRKAFYNTSAHYIWVGDRIKVGPSMASEALVDLLN
ncbi:hypothetical protein MPER_14141, partial [Moniliophthora perniciosa FA553]